jgi:hypothetical protein
MMIILDHETAAVTFQKLYNISWSQYVSNINRELTSKQASKAASNSANAPVNGRALSP